MPSKSLAEHLLGALAQQLVSAPWAAATDTPAPPAHTPTPTPATARPGIYRHYKGARYRVIGTALNAGNQHDSTEKVVVYVSQANLRMYTRPLTEFTELVNGVPRFERIADDE